MDYQLKSISKAGIAEAPTIDRSSECADIDVDISRIDHDRVTAELDRCPVTCLQTFANVFDRHDFSFKWTFAELDGPRALIPWTVRHAVVNHRKTAVLAVTEANLLEAERRAKAQLRAGQLPHAVYPLLERALQSFAEAEKIRPAGNDDAILRWNRCVRLLQTPSLAWDEQFASFEADDAPPR